MRTASLFALATVVVIGSAACQRDQPQPRESDAAVVSEALEAIADRTRVVTDYSYEGVAENLDTGEKMRFTYALKQPRMLRADVKDISTSFVFDGANLAILDGRAKKVIRQDLSEKDEATLIGALHQMFDSYSVEGWRPPMVRMKPEALAGRLERDEGGPLWVLSSALDDADVKEVRYYLRPPRADFVKKEFIGKGGEVLASSRVLEDKLDEKTRLRFPVAWERTDPRGRVRVRVDKPEINQGVAPERFQIVVPEGWALQEVGG